jgi:photosystem II stability/assembly factor-like uncharacterized protein
MGRPTRHVRVGGATLAALAAAIGIYAALAGVGPATATPPQPLRAAVVDLSWLNATTGWALAAEPCARTLCPRLARTDNGGRNWTELPSPPAQLTGSGCTRLPCVGQLRFATPMIGYLFGPSLLLTRDGGNTWTKLSGPQVESLEPGSGTVVRIAYDHSGCPGPCDRTVEVAAPGSKRWRALARLPSSAAGPEAAVSARVIRAGAQTLYVAVYGNLANGSDASQHTAIYRSRNAGRSWIRLADPCGGSGTNERDAIDLDAAPGGFLAALCAKRFRQPTVYSLVSSNDGGTSWGRRHPLPAAANYPNLIAAASPDTLLVATGTATGSGPYDYRLLLSTDGGESFHTQITDPEQLNQNSPGPRYLHFQTALIAHWVGDPNAIWSTTDGGHHWTKTPFP